MTEEELKYFLARVSFGGLIALFAVKLSLEKKKAFDIADFTKESYLTSEDYFSGFIVACYSMKLIDYNRKGNVLTILEIDSNLSSSIEAKLNAMAIGKPQWEESIRKVVNYFK